MFLTWIDESFKSDSENEYLDGIETNSASILLAFIFVDFLLKKIYFYSIEIEKYELKIINRQNRFSSK